MKALPVAHIQTPTVLSVAGTYDQRYLTTNVGQWVMHDSRRMLHHHVHRLSLAEHDATQTGDLISRVTSDIQTIPGGFYTERHALQFRQDQPDLVFAQDPPW